MAANPERLRRRGLARRLISAPARIRRAAESAETVVPGAGEWTAQQIVLHLVAVETVVFQRRLADLAEEESPAWDWVEPGPAESGEDETLADSLLRLAAARLATLDWVADLDEDGWQRSGRHATLGVLDVAGILALAADHDQDHLVALVRLRRS
jgi:DinB superfamily